MFAQRPEVNLRPGPLSLPTLPFETEPFTDLDVIVLTWLAAKEPLGSACRDTKCWVPGPSSGFYVDAEDLNSNPQAKI